jgi:hypothetical protein
MAALLQFTMMADAPIRLAGQDWGGGSVLAAAVNFDRIVVLGTFCYLPLVWWRIFWRSLDGIRQYRTI